MTEKLCQIVIIKMRKMFPSNFTTLIRHLNDYLTFTSIEMYSILRIRKICIYYTNTKEILRIKCENVMKRNFYYKK